MYSITEVEVVVGVVIVFTLTEAGADKVEADGEPCDSEPDSQAVVNDHTVEEEAFEAAVHEVEEPLLGGVGAMVPDVTSSVGRLLIEVLFSIPSSVLHLWYSKTLSVSESHVLHVSVLVVSKASSFGVHYEIDYK